MQHAIDNLELGKLQIKLISVCDRQSLFMMGKNTKSMEIILWKKTVINSLIIQAGNIAHSHKNDNKWMIFVIS